MVIMAHSRKRLKYICRQFTCVVFPIPGQSAATIGHLMTSMVTDKVLEIRRSNPYRPAVAVVAAEPDRPQTFILNQAAHGLLAHVQNISCFRDGVEWP